MHVDDVLQKMKGDEIDALRAYLERNFSGSKIDVVRGSKDDRYLCTITGGGDHYQLTVLDEAFSGPGFAGACSQLEAFQTASVMRDMIGFPVTVTQNGCIFDDV